MYDVRTVVLLKHVVGVWRTFAGEYGIVKPEAYLSSLHLMEAIESALIDMDRMSGWHLQRKLPDRHKYAGFVAKWLAKIRPIQFSKDLP